MPFPQCFAVQLYFRYTYRLLKIGFFFCLIQKFKYLPRYLRCIFAAGSIRRQIVFSCPLIKTHPCNNGVFWVVGCYPGIICTINIFEFRYIGRQLNCSCFCSNLEAFQSMSCTSRISCRLKHIAYNKGGFFRNYLFFDRTMLIHCLTFGILDSANCGVVFKTSTIAQSSICPGQLQGSSSFFHSAQRYSQIISVTISKVDAHFFCYGLSVINAYFMQYFYRRYID